MRKVSMLLVLLSAVLFFQFCSSSKKTASVTARAVTFESNIKPVIQATCAPCHIAGKGNKKSLDSYAGASSSADDIIARIQKMPGDHGFMPARNPRLPDSTILAFTEWKKSGLKEK